jgi:hypothetical protein
VYFDATDSFGPGRFGWYTLCDDTPLGDFARNKTTDIAKTTCEPCLQKLRRRGLDQAKAARDRIKQLDPLRGI